MSDDERGWHSTHERTPNENLRSLIRHLHPETPTAEVARLAFKLIPGAGDPTTVERIREAFARDHEVARARRWLDERDDSLSITVPERRTTPVDTDGVVPRAIVRTAVEHRLGERPARSCAVDDPESVVDCTGPDGPGYRCPDCGQQRRREEAILDELLNEVKKDRLDDSQRLTESTETDTEPERTAATDSTNESTETETQPPTTMPRDTTSDDATTTNSHGTDEETQADSTHDDGQSVLDAFASGDGGEYA